VDQDSYTLHFSLKFEDIAEARDGEDSTDSIIDAFDIDMSAFGLSVLQDAQEDAQTG
jgi:hypothetical protein